MAKDTTPKTKTETNPTPAPSSNLLGWQERVVTELEDNEAKIDKLNAFMDTKGHQALPANISGLMAKQRHIMHAMSNVLRQRIELF